MKFRYKASPELLLDAVFLLEFPERRFLDIRNVPASIGHEFGFPVGYRFIRRRRHRWAGCIPGVIGANSHALLDFIARDVPHHHVSGHRERAVVGLPDAIIYSVAGSFLVKEVKSHWRPKNRVITKRNRELLGACRKEL